VTLPDLIRCARLVPELLDRLRKSITRHTARLSPVLRVLGYVSFGTRVTPPARILQPVAELVVETRDE
jgi:hypothetical protein